VDRGQDEVVFVEQGNASLVAGRIRRVQREFGQETEAICSSWSKSPRRVFSVFRDVRDGVRTRHARSISMGHSEYRRLLIASTKPFQSSPARGVTGQVVKVGDVLLSIEAIEDGNYPPRFSMRGACTGRYSLKAPYSEVLNSSRAFKTPLMRPG
jgi:hypothetical protein